MSLFPDFNMTNLMRSLIMSLKLCCAAKKRGVDSKKMAKICDFLGGYFS
ncbi:hypothetical protein A11S_1938 [Micavibrio aeruginosavorus EPB]|uniref:Uncharacterized protein n=1 Tax=Micavibrio aeruginosavorus EPB TaxID=349215 RepID=M4VZW8_9BACT|nr:hypothetical protein A11S_1938 [Micavibrio aeruginosavorus EPB]